MLYAIKNLSSSPAGAGFPNFGSHCMAACFSFQCIGKITDKVDKLLLDGAPISGKDF